LNPFQEFSFFTVFVLIFAVIHCLQKIYSVCDLFCYCLETLRPTSSCGRPILGIVMSALINYLSSGSTFILVGHILNISSAYLVNLNQQFSSPRMGG
jgi:hypothetical protein